MKSLWNEWVNNRKWVPQKIVIQIEGHSTNKLALLCKSVRIMKIKERLSNYFILGERKLKTYAMPDSNIDPGLYLVYGGNCYKG